MECRSCGNSSLVPLLSLGDLPLANALVDPANAPESDARYPLDLVLCGSCSLVQITAMVPREALFREYPYFSSYSDGMLAHCALLAKRTIEEERLHHGSLVLEPASNDGYLLQYFARAGVQVLGVDPARNIARVAQERGVKTIPEFFGRALAPSLPKADVVVANNVLAHVDDPNGFIQAIASVLKPDGLVLIEVPYVLDMVDHCEFDTIYHEHLSYFSVTALDALLLRNGLRIFRVERVPIHGGSLLISARHDPVPQGPTVDQMLKKETELGVRERLPYRVLGHRMAGMRTSLVGLLGDLKAEGRSIAGYGAAAKATTLLNCFSIGRETLSFVADRSPHKHGRLIPGVRIPVRPAEDLASQGPDYTLILAWNFAEEIMAQQAAYREKGGRFILCDPELRIA